LTAYGALKKAAPLAATDPLLIIGAGGVGLSAVRLARALFEAPPIVAELDRSKWDLAREAGAGELIDPAADGAQRALAKATGGGVAAAIDFVGAGSSFDFGFGVLRKGGRLVSVGLIGGSTPMVPALLALKAVSIVGSYVGSLAEMRELITLARGGRLPALPVAMRPLAQADAALADLAAGRVRGRTVLKP
ncbi:MAG: zinc-binding dehydrogenase, partial [Rubrivivax sp.]|nr:zinc-binding dehydrogenase [Rubrivivax sp.]